MKNQIKRYLRDLTECKFTPYEIYFYYALVRCGMSYHWYYELAWGVSAWFVIFVQLHFKWETVMDNKHAT